MLTVHVGRKSDVNELAKPEEEDLEMVFEVHPDGFIKFTNFAGQVDQLRLAENHLGLDRPFPRSNEFGLCESAQSRSLGLLISSFRRRDTTVLTELPSSSKS